MTNLQGGVVIIGPYLNTIPKILIDLDRGFGSYASFNSLYGKLVTSICTLEVLCHWRVQVTTT